MFHFFKPKWNRPSDFDGLTIFVLLLAVLALGVLAMAFIQDVP